MAEICVIGAGPAGSTYAARMAQLGHDVHIVEAASFPRAHLGESLTPGVLPLLEMTGARRVIESAGFQPVPRVHVTWEAEPMVHENLHEQGLLVDRGKFDGLLLERARELGVRVRQPARAKRFEREGGRWKIEIEQSGCVEMLHADLLADASGRCAVTKPARSQTGCRTVALYAYWRGPNLPREPRIEASENLWSWGVPLPDGSYNTLIFVDVNHFRTASRASVTQRFLGLLAGSRLPAGLADAQMDGPVRVTDATPWLASSSVGPSEIRIGEAALAIDPISSSGVQKAIQTALVAAIVSNTLLRKPALTDAAIHFYESSLQEASARHCRWAATHYSSVAEQRGDKFWTDRAAGASREEPSIPRTAVDPYTLAQRRLALSSQVEFVQTPCLDGDFVGVKMALRHPNLDAPVAWVAGHEVEPLLRRMTAGSTAMQLAVSWSDQIPLSRGLAIANWLLNRGILVDASAVARPHI